jgi:hypothetical protein
MDRSPLPHLRNRSEQERFAMVHFEIHLASTRGSAWIPPFNGFDDFDARKGLKCRGHILQGV